MLLSAPLGAAGAEPRLPPPFVPPCVPPLGCLMSSAGRDVLKPTVNVAAAAAAAAAAAVEPCAPYLASGYHPGVTAATLLQLGYSASAPAGYPAYQYPVYAASAPRPPQPHPHPHLDVQPGEPPLPPGHPLYPLGFRSASSRKEALVAPPAAARAAPQAVFRPLGGGGTGKEGVLRVPAHYPSLSAVYAPPPAVGYPAAGTPPRSAVPPLPVPSAAAGYSSYVSARTPSSEAPTRQPSMRTSSGGSASDPTAPPAKRARVDTARSCSSEQVRSRCSGGSGADCTSVTDSGASPAVCAVGGTKATEMPSAVSTENYSLPEHFRLGSVIELADGRLKRVEELRTEDFETSADQSAELRLYRSVVTRIEERGRTAHIVFAVGSEQAEVSVEAQLEHPFFVFHRGWSSCRPSRTLQMLGLPCHQLTVGDACVSVAPRPAAAPAAADGNHASNNSNHVSRPGQ